jgi:hypothetical protein
MHNIGRSVSIEVCVAFNWSINPFFRIYPGHIGSVPDYNILTGM